MDHKLIDIAVSLAAAAVFSLLCWYALKSGTLIGKFFSVDREDSPVLFRLGLATYAAMALISIALAILRSLGFILH